MNLLTCENRPAGSQCTSHAVRTCAAFATINSLWNHALPEMGVGAGAGLLVRRVYKSITSDQKPDEVSTESRAMAVGAFIFAGFGLV